jgi:hypothetical protein
MRTDSVGNACSDVATTSSRSATTAATPPSIRAWVHLGPPTRSRAAVVAEQICASTPRTPTASTATPTPASPSNWQVRCGSCSATATPPQPTRSAGHLRLGSPSMGPNQNHLESGTTVPPILPSLRRQPPRIRANNGGLSRMRIRRWRACTKECEPSRTGLQSPCKRKVVSSILTGGSRYIRAFPLVERVFSANIRSIEHAVSTF